jgi:hypothetical protein
LSSSLDSYLAMPLTNPKLVSLLRQQASISQTLHLVRNLCPVESGSR